MSRGFRALLGLILLSASAAAWGQPSLRQQLHQINGVWYYTVNNRAPSLSMVARELYGDLSAVRDIAVWNGLTVKSQLNLGQELILKRPPRYKEPVSTALLVEAWRAQGNEEMARRLLGTAAGPRTVQTAPSPKRVQPNAPAAESGSEATPAEAEHRTAPAHSNASPPAPASEVGHSPTPGKSQIDSPSLQVINPYPGFKLKRRPSSDPSSHDNGEPKADSYWLGDHAQELIDTITRKLNLISKSKASPEPHTPGK